MAALATRTLTYTDDTGTRKESNLTVFTPFETKTSGWKCEFKFEPPIYQTTVSGAGADFIHAFLVCLKVARIFLESTDLFGRVHWQGMLDCGLLSRGDEPASSSPADRPPTEGNTESLDVLTTRRLGYPDESGVERELLLTIFVPCKTEGDLWKCGFVFGLLPDASVRYGVGADAIEALLDALARARATFAGKVPKDWESSEDLLDCADFPYRVGRAFRTDLGGGPSPDESDLSAG